MIKSTVVVHLHCLTKNKRCTEIAVRASLLAYGCSHTHIWVRCLFPVAGSVCLWSYNDQCFVVT